MEQVHRFHSVDGDNVGNPVAVDGEVLHRSTDDFKGSLVLLLYGLLDCVYPDEDMSAAVETKVLEGEVRGCTG